MMPIKKSNSGYVKRKWSSEEDVVLGNILRSNGPLNWNTVATCFPERTGKQCRERWHNHLLDGIKKGEWTKEEDSIIMTTHAHLGNQWAKISKLLNGRSENGIKNRFYSLERRQQHNKRDFDEWSASITIAGFKSDFCKRQRCELDGSHHSSEVDASACPSDEE